MRNCARIAWLICQGAEQPLVFIALTPVPSACLTHPSRCVLSRSLSDTSPHLQIEQARTEVDFACIAVYFLSGGKVRRWTVIAVFSLGFPQSPGTALGESLLCNRLLPTMHLSLTSPDPWQILTPLILYLCPLTRICTVTLLKTAHHFLITLLLQCLCYLLPFCDTGHWQIQ